MKRENLQSFRNSKNLTQEQMARQLDITVAHYKAIAESINIPVYIVEGHYNNFKITTKYDFLRMKNVLNNS